MQSASVTVGTSATVIVASDDKYRTIYLHNAGGGKVYLGGADVTSSTGYHLANAESMSLDVPLGESVYAVSASGTNDVIVLRPNAD